MDIAFRPESESFRFRLRTWLEENWHPELATEAFQRPDDHDKWFQFRLEWEKRLHEAGYACPHWPVEYGGLGLTLEGNTVYYEEIGRAGLPDLANSGGKNLLAPILLAHGTEWQRQRFLPGILKTEDIWCQGYSEPNAGSDLAGLQCRAHLEGDEWVITGQKTWSTAAPYADWCFGLVRTDRTAQRHNGITFLLIPMKQPGVTVRPIRQITGDREFAEIFFDRARTSGENVVGQVNRGWEIAVSLLGYERGMIAINRHARLRREWEVIVDLARTVPSGRYTRAIDNPVTRERLVRLDLQIEALRLVNYRYLTQYLADRPPGPEGSVTKATWPILWQNLTELALDIMEVRSELWRGAPDAVLGGYFVQEYLHRRAHSIAGGTVEIQHNIIADRILGLPR